MKRRNALGLLGGLPLAAGVPPAARRTTSPTRPVRIVVPFGPGGSGDIVSRIVAHELETDGGPALHHRQQAGRHGDDRHRRSCKNAPADGYTLLHGSTSSLAANPSLYKQMTYDPDDFTTVAVDGTSRASCWWQGCAVQDGEGIRGLGQGAQARRADLLGLRQHLLARAVGAVRRAERRHVRRGRLRTRCPRSRT